MSSSIGSAHSKNAIGLIDKGTGINKGFGELSDGDRTAVDPEVTAAGNPVSVKE